MQIAIQGALGSFHHEAALQLKSGAIIVPKQTFADVFEAVWNEEVTHGLCATTNTLYGPLSEVHHLLEQYDVSIITSVSLHVTQQLIGPCEVTLDELASSPDVCIFSQAPALGQITLWLSTHLPHATPVETYDTAASVQKVVSLDQSHTLAVAGRFAAATYGGTIIAEDIQDHSQNFTDFILFTKKSGFVHKNT